MKKIIQDEAPYKKKKKKQQALEEHARCRRCADDGRQLCNGCSDEDVLLVLLAERDAATGLMCCVFACARAGAKAVVGRRCALGAGGETTPPVCGPAHTVWRICKHANVNPVNSELVIFSSCYPPCSNHTPISHIHL